MSFLLAWIILAPLFGATLIGALYLYSITKRPIPKQWFTLLALTTPFISFALGVYLSLHVAQGEVLHYRPYMWMSIDTFDIYMGFLGDRLSLFMVLFITFVGGLIHLYASSYMQDDAGYGKFFFYFNLFLASMLLLVLADGPLIMFIGWEGVGLCSYLLIGYYYEEGENVMAGNKAFWVNRIGDMGFLIGLALLYFYCGDYGFDYASIGAKMAAIPSWVVPLSGVMLFIGAMGKSAQIPLYVWLPDAMAGPTPVSALIHAATMVTAGVYMVTRFAFLYDTIPDVGLFIAYIGGAGALFAAIIATKQSDIKKILAYSTMSQLGYMFMAVGVGAYASGMFHVFTHAFFKALLFMGAGALIVMLHHEQNIFKMGQMRRHAPLLYGVMLIATLAICGIPPFAGFFSKDEILMALFVKEHYLLWGMGVVGALLTSYYMFRLFFVVFEGEHAHHHHALNPISWGMKAPLVVLAVGAIGVGWLGLPSAMSDQHLIAQWLGSFGGMRLHVSHNTEWLLMGLNILISGAGILLAYVRFKRFDLRIHPSTKGLIYHKFYIDELYEKLFVRPLYGLSMWFSVNVDVRIVDAVVMGISRGFVRLGRVLISVQNAHVRFYAMVMLCGVSAISLYLIVLVG